MKRMGRAFRFFVATMLPLVWPAPASSSGQPDFNGDGKTDILWRNEATGENSIWLMDGVNPASFLTLTKVEDRHWQMAGSGDFNGDGKPDILWRNYATGENSIWLMNGVEPASFLTITKVDDLHWQMAGGGDFNGDGKSDILWHNQATGESSIWLMDGVNPVSFLTIAKVDDLARRLAGSQRPSPAPDLNPAITAIAETWQVPGDAFQILKLDPNPVAAGAGFSLVVRLRNFRDAPLRVDVEMATDSPERVHTFDLAPNETRVAELGGFFLGAGAHEVHAIATWQTDQTVTVPKGPTEIERRPVFEKLGEGTAPVTVYPADAPPVRPRLVDLGPDQPAEENGGVIGSGVVGALAGSEDALFAVAKSGGVWRSVNGGPWAHLAGSPPRAFAIALDPTNGNHIAVGERDDDNPDPRLGRSGLWESTDFGNTWTYTFDPASVASSQRIAAVAFARTTGTLLVATGSGVARRPRSQTANPFAEAFSLGFRDAGDPGCNTAGSRTQLGPVTALVASETRLWARTATELFYSDDDGRTWRCSALPATVDLPGDPGAQAEYASGGLGGNDSQSLAAFDDQAYVIFRPTVVVPSSDPRASFYDPRCDPQDQASFVQGFDRCVIQSVTALLIFRPATGTYLAQYTGDHDGRGGNGRRFVRAFAIDQARCPAWASRAIGAGRQVFVSHAQSVQQALSVDAAGRLVLDDFVGTAGATGAGPSYFYLDANGRMVMRDPEDRPDWKRPIHSDLWDVLLPDDYCPPGKASVFLATDGGVYRGSPGDAGNPRIAAMSWRTRSEGLHIHTAQNLAIVESPTVPPPVLGQPVVPVDGIAYPTQDNDGWWRRADGKWVAAGNQGDSNFVAGDAARPAAILWRQLTPGKAAFFSGSQGPTSFTFNRDTQGRGQTLDGSATIQAVQTLSGEAAPSSLDLVMLAQLPLPDSQGNPVGDPPGGAGSGQRWALLRNEDFENALDGPANSFSGWRIVSDQLPVGARRLWLSGGHARTQYFLYTDGTNATCPRGLQHLSVVAAAAGGRPLWRCLIANLLDETDSVGAGVVRQQGPAFVDPYDPKVLLVAVAATAGAQSTVRASLDGGASFCELPVLRALLTESGRYSLVGSYSPDATFMPLGSRFHGFPLSVPSAVAFHRHSPAQMLVASPYTGLYLGSVAADPNAPGGCVERWQDVSPALPTSRSYISAAAFAHTAAVVATAGRGVFAIADLRSAQPASYFETSPAAAPGDAIATLRTGSGAALAWGRVLVTATDETTGERRLNQVQIRTGEAGRLILPPVLDRGATYVIELGFAGDGETAPSVAKFRLRIS